MSVDTEIRPPTIPVIVETEIRPPTIPMSVVTEVRPPTVPMSVVTEVRPPTVPMNDIRAPTLASPESTPSPTDEYVPLPTRMNEVPRSAVVKVAGTSRFVTLYIDVEMKCRMRSSMPNVCFHS
jgi:hypothetical protein